MSEKDYTIFSQPLSLYIIMVVVILYYILIIKGMQSLLLELELGVELELKFLSEFSLIFSKRSAQKDRERESAHCDPPLFSCLSLTVQRSDRHSRHRASRASRNEGLQERSVLVRKSAAPTHCVKFGKQREIDHRERHIPEWRREKSEKRGIIFISKVRFMYKIVYFVHSAKVCIPHVSWMERQDLSLQIYTHKKKLTIIFLP